jgi:hypothetical protein
MMCDKFNFVLLHLNTLFINESISSGNPTLGIIVAQRGYVLRRQTGLCTTKAMLEASCRRLYGRKVVIESQTIPSGHLVAPRLCIMPSTY